MQRHNLAGHMQDFTQMHMLYMADFLSSLNLNGSTPKSLGALGHSVSFEDQGATAMASASPCSKGPASGACVPYQPSEERQRMREMDKRLVTHDHQLRELIILKESQVKDIKIYIYAHMNSGKRKH